MTSTLKSDVLTSKTTNGDLTISGDGSGVPNLEAGFKVGGTAGVPVSALRAGTDGELITWDASGVAATVPVGSATNVLTSNGAGAAPTFQAAAGGAWGVLASGTFSTASTLNITGITKTTKFIVTTTAVSTATRMQILTSSDGGSSWDGGSADYNFRGIYANSATSTLTMERGHSGQSLMTVVCNNIDATTGSSTTEIILYDPQLAAPTSIFWRSVWDEDTSAYTNWGTGGGQRLAAADVDAFQISPMSGNFTGSYTVLELN